MDKPTVSRPKEEEVATSKPKVLDGPTVVLQPITCTITDVSTHKELVFVSKSKEIPVPEPMVRSSKSMVVNATLVKSPTRAKRYSPTPPSKNNRVK